MNFNEAENVGRNKFRNLCESRPIENLKFTEDKYNNLDGYFDCGDDHYAVEIKDRWSDYEEWNIEETKYLALKKEIEDGKVTGGYFAVFFKDDVWLYNFDTIKECYDEYGITNMYAKKTTCGNSSYTTKKILTLPKTKGIHYAKVKDQWIKIETTLKSIPSDETSSSSVAPLLN